jgi:hypothetical protein
MRKKNQIQMPLIPSGLKHPRARELEQISEILNPTTILKLEAPTSFSDVKGRPDGFFLGSILPHQVQHGHRTA